MLPLLKRYWYLPAAILALVIGYGAGSGWADERAARANAQAAQAAAQAAAAQAVADTALERSAASQAALQAMGADRATALARLAQLKAQLAARGREPVAGIIPVGVDTAEFEDVTDEFEILENSLVAAEAVIHQDSLIIQALTADRARLSSALTQSQNALGVASRELEAQSHRTERAPRKFLGFLPMPTLTLGAGGTLAGGRIHTGPTATLGWSVKL